MPPKWRKHCLNEGHCLRLIRRTVKVELQELTNKLIKDGTWTSLGLRLCQHKRHGGVNTGTKETRQYWYVGNVTRSWGRKPVLSLSASQPLQSTLRNCKLSRSQQQQPQQPTNRVSVSDNKKRSVFKAFLRTKLQGAENTELVCKVDNECFALYVTDTNNAC